MGEIQSRMFGKFINKLYNSKDKKIKGLFNNKKIKIYSSLLKRAMITAKYISIELDTNIYNKDKINRLCNVSESLNILESLTGLKLTSYTTIDISQEQVQNINKGIEGFDINDDMSGLKLEGCNNSSYESFKKNALPLLGEEYINIIVSHGKFIKGLLNNYLNFKGLDYNNLKV